MYIPVSGYIEPISSPLLGNSELLSNGFPEWFLQSPTGMIHSLLSIYGYELDKVNYFVNNLYYGSLPGDGNLYEPRVAHIIPKIDPPFYFNGNLISEAKNFSDFYFAISPAYYELDNSVLFRNLDKEISYSVGVTGSAVEDKLYYYSDGLVLQNKFYSSSEITDPLTGYVISPKVTSNVLIDTIVGSVTGVVVGLRNHWDSQALLSGVYRRSNESNIVLERKISAALLNHFSENDLTKRVCTELGLVNSFELGPGESRTYFGEIFSNVAMTSYAKETIYPSKNYFWEGATLPKKTLSYYKNKGTQLPISNGSIDTNVPVYIEYIYNNWEVFQGVVHVSKEFGGNSSSSFNKTINFVDCYGIRINSLVSLKNKIYGYSGLTDLGYTISKELEKSSMLYGNVKWGKLASLEVSRESLPTLFQD